MRQIFKFIALPILAIILSGCEVLLPFNEKKDISHSVKFRIINNCSDDVCRMIFYDENGNSIGKSHNFGSIYELPIKENDLQWVKGDDKEFIKAESPWHYGNFLRNSVSCEIRTVMGNQLIYTFSKSDTFPNSIYNPKAWAYECKEKYNGFYGLRGHYYKTHIYTYSTPSLDIKEE